MTVRKWGSERLVNTVFAGDQGDPSVAALADGGYVMAWTDASDVDYNVIRIQRFDAQGVAVGTEQMIAGPGAREPHLTALANGGFSLSYQSLFSATDFDPVVALFDAGGALVTSVDLDFSPNRVDQIRSATNGTGMVAVWHETVSGKIVAGRVTSAGVLAGSTFAVNLTSDGSQHQPDVAELADGRLAFVWGSVDQFAWGPVDQIHFRIFDGTGGSPSTEISFAVTSFYSEPRVVALSGGGALVIYGTEAGGAEQYGGVRGRMFDSTGNQIGAEMRINTTSAGDQLYPEIAAMPDGGFAAVWWDGFTVKGRVFDAFGDAKSDEFTVSTSGIASFQSDDLAVTALADGRLVVTWAGSVAGADNSGFSVHSQIIDPRDGNIVGDASANTLYGHALVNDEITALGGDDRLFGLGGDDALYGGDGSDWLDGGAGNDLMYGGIGNDMYLVNSAAALVQEAAGEGIDTVRSAVTYSLGANVEKLYLTGTAAVNATGNGLANTILGNGAANILTGAGGRDILKGGDGADRFVYKALSDSTVAAGGRDIIQDFTHAQGDRIDLSAIDAVTGGTNQAFTFIGTTAFTHHAGELRYALSGGDTIVSGDVNGDGVADFSILLTGAKTLVAGDFVL